MLRLPRLFAVALASTLASRVRRGPLRPSWPFMFEWVVRYLRRDWEETASWPLPVLRADMDRRPFPMGAVKQVDVRDGELGGVPVRRFLPRGERRPGVVLYLHGGSYIYGSTRTTHQDLLARLTLGTRIEHVGVEYRLAPEHPYPAQREDALAAWDALVGSGVSPASIVVAGDSAGGNLALVLALALRDRGTPLPRALVLLSPWGDLTMPGASYSTNVDTDFGTRAELVTHARAFAGGAALTDPGVSPAFAELRGLPAVLVEVGDAELPRDDVLALADRLRAAQVDVTLHVAKDMPHNAILFSTMHPEGQVALDAMTTFVSTRLASAPATAQRPVS